MMEQYMYQWNQLKGAKIMSNKELSFEDAMEALEKIVIQLEDDQLPLEKSIELYEQGMKLSKQCDVKLKQAEEKLTQIVNENNDLSLFEIDEVEQ